jgi:hypothetical protein
MVVMVLSLENVVAVLEAEGQVPSVETLFVILGRTALTV